MSKIRRNVIGALGAAGIAGILFMPAAQGAHEVVIKNGAFTPAEEYVGQGDTVTWVHDDGGQAHSVTADDGSFDSSPACSAAAADQCLHAGQVFRFTFDKLGRYPYYSRTSGGPGGSGTAGTIVVVKKASGTTSTTMTR